MKAEKSAAVDIIFPTRGLEKPILDYIILPLIIVLISVMPVDKQRDEFGSFKYTTTKTGTP